MLAFEGYKTKKLLKQSVGENLGYTETSFFGDEYMPNGEFTGVGPTAYNRKWYATVTMVNGKIAKVQ
jgi:hypothetical protein|tara:strand:- start:3446 stop:3646 length:201 start_codon:yes stop_codon:yes gene_type:complete